jgi:putative ABC transport system substrate-binding protein
MLAMSKAAMSQSNIARPMVVSMPALAAELTADPVAVIIALFSPTAAVAAKAATATIPIVFAIGADPVDLGLVSSLNRPGGNVTGVTFFINTLGAKRLELLYELVPNSSVVGFLVNPGNPTTESQTSDVQTAARKLGIDLPILNASSERDIARHSHSSSTENEQRATMQTPQGLDAQHRRRAVSRQRE